MARIQSSAVPLQYSTDSGTTWKTLVCLKSASWKGNTAISKEETFCDTYAAVGASDWSWDFEAVTETSPTSDQGSYEELLGLWKTKTAFLVKQSHGTSGADFYKSGTVYLSSLSDAASVGALFSFSGTLTGDGELDIAF